MLLTAPDIEEISQDEINEIVDRILLPSTGGGDPPDIWEKAYGGGKPDGDDNGSKDSLMYLVAWGCILSIWTVGIFKAMATDSIPTHTMTYDKPPIALKALNQNRPQLDLLLTDLNTPYGAFKLSPPKSCPVP